MSEIRQPGRQRPSRSASVRRQGIPQGVPVPPGDQPRERECALYRFWVRHPETGQRALGYVGETARMPFQRLMEHIYQQPWADTIIAWEVDPVTYPGKAVVLAAERTAIERELPLYNVDGNLGNPSRIPPGRAALQRRARDPDWTQPQRNVRVPRQRAPRAAARRPARPAAVPGWLDRQWRRHRTALSAGATAWVALFALVWWLGADAWTGWREPRNAAVGASLALAGLVWWWRRAARPKRRRTRRRSRR